MSQFSSSIPMTPLTRTTTTTTTTNTTASTCPADLTSHRETRCNCQPPSPLTLPLPALPEPVYSILTPTTRTTIYSHNLIHPARLSMQSAHSSLASNPASESLVVGTFVPMEAKRVSGGNEARGKKGARITRRVWMVVVLGIITTVVGVVVWQQTKGGGMGK